MDSTPGIKMKFCESLDRFVAIRSFTPEQKQQLFKNIKITDKKSYKRLIINASVVNYLDEMSRHHRLLRPLGKIHRALRPLGRNNHPVPGNRIVSDLRHIIYPFSLNQDICLTAFVKLLRVSLQAGREAGITFS